MFVDWFFIIEKKIYDCLENRRKFRIADRGEFTKRAFLNGKMDLSQAESVADLISSNSEASHKLAMNQMRGGFKNDINDLRTELVNFASLIELELDFSQEDVEFANMKELNKLLDKIMGSTYQGDKKMGHGDFKCPKGAGIYRIDAVYTSDKNSKESSGIKGLKFFCRNVKTGEDVLIKDKNENIFMTGPVSEIKDINLRL